MNKTTWLIGIQIILFIAALTSCKPSVPKPQLEETNPHIRGEITSLTKVSNGNVVIRVEGEIEEDTLFDKVDVAVKAETNLFIKDSQGYRPAAKDDLATGQIIEALFVGPIAESYPYKATASEVVILHNESYLNK